MSRAAWSILSQNIRPKRRKVLCVSKAETSAAFKASPDVSGPLFGSDKLFYRVNGLARDSGSHVQYTLDNQDYIAPSMLWKPSSRTSLLVLANYLDFRTGSEIGFLPAQGLTLAGGKIAPNPNGNIPTSFFSSDTNYDNYHKTEYFAGTQFQQQLSEHWTMRNNYRFLHLGLPQYIGLYGTGYLQTAPDCAINPNAPDCTNILTRSAILSNENNTQYALDQQLQGNYRWNKWSHTLLAGYNYQHQGTGIHLGYGPSDNDGTPGDPANPPNINIFDPVYGVSVPSPGYSTTDVSGTLQQHGVYAQDQVAYGHLQMLLGGREDWAPQHLDDHLADQQTDINPSRFTYRAGALYHFDKGLAPYFSYSTSFNPVFGINPSSNLPFKPDSGRQYEVGLKYEPQHFNAVFTAALYQITQQNLVTANPVDPQITDQSAEQRSRGLEVEAHASLFHSVNLVASYDHQKALYTKPFYGVVGAPILTVPENQASLWVDYTPARGFGVGAGARFNGKNPGVIFDPATPDANFYVDSTTLFDAEVHYEIRNMRFGFYGQNLLDKTYVSYCQGATSCNYGFRRRVNGNVTYRFYSLLKPWRKQ